MRRSLNLVLALLASTLLMFGVGGVAMAQTGSTTIHAKTLQVGQTTFGPYTLRTATSATLTLNRTGAGELNSLTSASELDILIQTSSDGGTTWQNDIESNQFGGIIIGPKGQVNTWVLAVSGFPNTRNGIRLIATVSGPSSIVVDGTVSTS